MEVDLIPPCLGLCTVPTISSVLSSVPSSVPGLSYFCVWLSSVAQSCAARDESNKDNLCTPTISAGINRSPPSRPSRIYPECRTHKTRLAVKDSFSAWTLRESVCCIIWRIRWRARTAEGKASPLEKDSVE